MENALPEEPEGMHPAGYAARACARPLIRFGIRRTIDPFSKGRYRMLGIIFLELIQKCGFGILRDNPTSRSRCPEMAVAKSGLNLRVVQIPGAGHDSTNASIVHIMRKPNHYYAPLPGMQIMRRATRCRSEAIPPNLRCCLRPSSILLYEFRERAPANGKNGKISGADAFKRYAARLIAHSVKRAIRKTLVTRRLNKIQAIGRPKQSSSSEAIAT
jgi:hypothetical protein